MNRNGVVWGPLGTGMVLTLALLSSSLACSSDAGKENDVGGSAQGAAAGTGAASGSGGAGTSGSTSSERQGTFSVDMHEATPTNPARTNVLGIIYDGPPASGE